MNKNPEEKKQSSGKSGVRKNKQPKRKGKSQIIILCCLALIIVGGLLAIAPLTLTRSDNEVNFIIPKDATIENIKDTLYKYYPKRYADRVLYLVNVRDVDFSKRTGLYKIEKGSSPFMTMRRIYRGSQTPVRLTINHFRTLQTISEAISKKMNFTYEEFIKAAQDSTILSSYGLTPEQALSLFLEDTYEVYWSSSPEEVIKKIGENYKDLWSPRNLKKAEELGVTPAQLMIIASITDEETNKTDEKGTIGTLYLNRLNSGMRLQADPTVRYAIGNFSIQRVTNEHLKFDSPYNTYRVDGLPPGPIRTTSSRTVKEIIDAEPNDYLYMCAKEDFSGYHNFATNYEEHTQNALRYQHELDKRNIR